MLCSSTRTWLIMFLVMNIGGYFFENKFCNFYRFEGRGHNSDTCICRRYKSMTNSVVSNLRSPSNDLKQNTAKTCNRNVLKMKIRQLLSFVIFLKLCLLYLHEDLHRGPTKS